MGVPKVEIQNVEVARLSTKQIMKETERREQIQLRQDVPDYKDIARNIAVSKIEVREKVEEVPIIHEQLKVEEVPEVKKIVSEVGRLKYVDHEVEVETPKVVEIPKCTGAQ